jgi:hypothetical protein
MRPWHVRSAPIVAFGSGALVASIEAEDLVVVKVDATLLVVDEAAHPLLVANVGERAGMVELAMRPDRAGEEVEPAAGTSFVPLVAYASVLLSA